MVSTDMYTFNAGTNHSRYYLFGCHCIHHMCKYPYRHGYLRKNDKNDDGIKKIFLYGIINRVYTWYHPEVYYKGSLPPNTNIQHRMQLLSQVHCTKRRFIIFSLFLLFHVIINFINFFLLLMFYHYYCYYFIFLVYSVIINNTGIFRLSVTLS